MSSCERVMSGPYQAISCRANSCRMVPDRASPYCVVPWCAVPCRVLPCRAVPCRAVPCQRSDLWRRQLLYYFIIQFYCSTTLAYTLTVEGMILTLFIYSELTRLYLYMHTKVSSRDGLLIPFRTIVVCSHRSCCNVPTRRLHRVTTTEWEKCIVWKFSSTTNQVKTLPHNGSPRKHFDM